MVDVLHNPLFKQMLWIKTGTNHGISIELLYQIYKVTSGLYCGQQEMEKQLHSSKAYNVFRRMRSDHRVVTARTKPSLRTCKPPKSQINFDRK